MLLDKLALIFQMYYILVYCIYYLAYKISIFKILTNLWVPDENYPFPLLEKNLKRGLRFQQKWLKEFNWLAYSNEKNGTFCKYCVVFARSGGVGNQPLGNLVTVAFNNWKKAKEVLY